MAVAAHPARLDVARCLAASLDAHLVLDDGGGEWDTHARAWASLVDQDADWGIVVQDDAIPIPGFRGHLAAGLAAAPVATCVSAYVGDRRPPQIQRRVLAASEEASRTGAAWLTSTSLHWGVAVALPRTQIAQVIGRPCPLPYDERIGAAYRCLLRLPVLYTWPSLVDHADMPTLVAHADGVGRDKSRKAHRVGIPLWNSRTVSI